MTQESLNLADTYKQIADAEKQALFLEKMLDDLDTKMDSILHEIEKKDQEGMAEAGFIDAEKVETPNFQNESNHD